MQIIAFELKRNQILDLQRGLKMMLKDYDDTTKKGRFVVGKIMANKDYTVEIGLDRMKDLNHPLQKQLLKETQELEAKAKAKNVENVQKVPDGSKG